LFKNKQALFLAFLCLTAACGTKQPSSLLSNQGPPGGICPDNYDPIPLNRDNAAAIPNITLLPPGQYNLSATETYIDIAGRDGFKLHYLEDIGETQLIRRFCSTPINPNETYTSLFSSIWQYTVPVEGGAGSQYMLRTYSLGALKGRPILTTQNGSGFLSGTFLPILQSYQSFRIYQTATNEYEIRARFEGVEDGRNLKKRFLLRLRRSSL
jgi:hypothetical protein